MQHLASLNMGSIAVVHLMTSESLKSVMVFHIPFISDQTAAGKLITLLGM
jgi:hypothetical protein